MVPTNAKYYLGTGKKQNSLKAKQKLKSTRKTGQQTTDQN